MSRLDAIEARVNVDGLLGYQTVTSVDDAKYLISRVRRAEALAEKIIGDIDADKVQPTITYERQLAALRDADG